MSLPAVDLGIMAEHLSTHEGMINKLKIYYPLVTNPVLKELLSIHINVLRNHVQAMLTLIDPYQKGSVHLHQIGDINIQSGYSQFSEQEKDITLDVTAKLDSTLFHK